MKNPAPHKRILLLSLWLLCGLAVVGLQSGRYFLEPLVVAQEIEQEAQTTSQSDTPTQEEQEPAEQEYATVSIASEALLPILKNLPQPLIFQYMELVLIEEVNLPAPVVKTVTQTGYFKILFRQIISPNAP